MPLSSQYFQALLFYAVFFLFTGIGLPVTAKIFHDKLVCWGTSRLLGFSLFGYFIWLLSSLKILNYQNTPWLYVLFLAMLSAACWIIYKNKKNIFPLPWRSILTGEVILLMLYVAYLYLRSMNPSAYGTERFMDMMLMTGSSKSSHFPFSDSWYAGQLINYYYYGQYLLGMLARLAHVDYALAYNFSIGLLYSTATGLAGLFVYWVTKSKLFAAFAGFLITTAGNLFYSGCVIKTYLAHQAICSYASSTRLYTPSYIINEIPSYSFTVGDLHAHFIALPFFLLCMFFLYQLFQAKKMDPWLLLVLCVGFTTSALINPTDAVSLVLLMGAIVLSKLLQNYRQSLFRTVLGNAGWIWSGGQVILLVGILTLPFTYFFRSPVLGLGFAPVFAATNNLVGQTYQYPTPLLAELGMWGAFAIPLVWFFTLKKNRTRYSFFLLMFLCAAFLVIFVELFFVKDIYHIANPPYFRANTTFKFGYHIWTFLCLGFACCLCFAMENLKLLYKKLFYFCLIVFVIFSCFYPYQAVKQFYLADAFSAKSLDALQFMQLQYPEDYAAIRFLNALKGNNRPVVMEAVGDSYSYFGRISAFAGTIAPMGWKTHEWTWRFDGTTLPQQKKINPHGPFETGFSPIAAVAQDVQLLYETNDLASARIVLQKYRAQYVYVGNLERSTYPGLNEQKFYQLGTEVFSSGPSQLFLIK